MKTRIFLLTSLLLLVYCATFSNKEVNEEKKIDGTTQIQVYSSQDLYELTSIWADGYNKQHPGISINANIAKVPGTGNNLAFFTADDLEGVEAAWKMVVGREILVAVINPGNPLIKEISENGVSREMIVKLVKDSEKRGWSTLSDKDMNVPVHFYLNDDKTVRKVSMKYLEMVDFDGIGIIADNDAKVIEAVQKDPGGFGFCKLSSLVGPGGLLTAENIRLLPIDKNGNGKLDNIEDIYGDLDDFTRGVWIGKYPKALSNEIYAVSAEPPAGEEQVAFMNWILTDGQQFLPLAGFSDLVYSEARSKLERINEVNEIIPPAKEAYSAGKLILFIVIASLLLSVVIGALIGYGRNTRVLVKDVKPSDKADFDEHSVAAPRGLYYDKTHTWAFMEKDGTVKVGIDDFLQHITGPITRVEMKKPGDKIVKGELLVSIIQKGKQLNLYAPVTGSIQECNQILKTNSSIINSSPYYDGWIYKIEPAKWTQEIPLLSMATKYTKWLSEEINRLRDFAAVSLNSSKAEYAGIVLQDGGMMKNNLLEDFGPEVWEDFQSNFLDINK